MSIVVLDDWVNPSLLLAVQVNWPKNDWPHWHKYNDKNSIKLASKDSSRLHESSKLIIQEMSKIDVQKLFNIHQVFPDLDLHGAGLHEILPQGHLQTHLDSNVHPLMGWKRELNAVLFVNTIEEKDGGALQFFDESCKQVVKTVQPKFNRLVLFQTNDVTWHGVTKTQVSRKTLSLFWWSLNNGDGNLTRESAKFV